MRHSSQPRFLAALCGGLMVCALWGCASRPRTPPTVAPPPPPPVALDTKVSWLLRLEQQRTLRDDTLQASPAASRPDLEVLIGDPEVSVRRRAAIAIGRIGAAEGVPILAKALGDAEESVRAAAAFGLGLIGAKEGIEPLTATLKDPSALVRGRAVEGLGLIGDPAAASAVAESATGCAEQLAAIEPDDEQWPKTPEIEACRLTLFALVRLRNFDALARVALNDTGQPVSRWWPVAYALQRSGDAKAAPALLVLAASQGVYTPAFAIRGLAALKDARVAPIASAIATQSAADVRLRVAAVRALGQVGGADAVEPLMKLAVDRSTARNLALESVTALTAIGDPRPFNAILDLITDPWPAMRSAALAAAAKMNPDAFLIVLSSIDRDADWSVRASLVQTLSTLPPERVQSAIQELVADDDVRVRGPALDALHRINAPDIAKRLFDALDAPDFVVRATAARLMGERKLQSGIPRLVAAYKRGEGDATYVARAAALEALAKYGGEEAVATLQRALGDRDWPVRWRAAELLRGLGEATAAPERPAPVRQPADFFESAGLLRPAVSPHAFIETRHGTIHLELNVVDAPFTTHTFMELARTGFFNGVRIHRVVPHFVIQAGDPRGDGEGGPGYTIRDELSPIPYLRGTVGMALDWRDTAGSQFFITVSPQPHLDARYTVFGRVINGLDLLDRLSQWDTIDRVRIWDGTSLK